MHSLPTRALLFGDRFRRILHHVIALGALHAVLIWVVINDGMLAPKIIPRRRGRNAPLQRSRIPRIVRGQFSAEAAINQVKEKNEFGPPPVTKAAMEINLCTGISGAMKSSTKDEYRRTLPTSPR